jgi:ABC-2 type transport system ATP-binding protein
MTDRNGEKMIDLQNMKVAYGSFLALKGITLSMEGGAVGLLGPNGAGKSTLIKALLGLLECSFDRGALLGCDVGRAGLDIRKKVGYAPEHDCHIPGMNGFEYVSYAGRLVGMPSRDARRRAHEVLEYVGLGEARYRSVDGYSTGMRQRVKVAQALVHDPELLILDEPTNGFDPKGREDVLDLIYDVSHNKEMHLLLSSHLLKDVEKTCDSVILLKDGEVARSGRIEELKARSDKIFDIEVRGDREEFRAAAAEAGWRYQFENTRGMGKLFVPLEVRTAEIFGLSRRLGFQLRTLVPAEESLEDLFLKSVED